MAEKPLCYLCVCPVGSDGRFLAVEVDEDGNTVTDWICGCCLSGEEDEVIRVMNDLANFADE